MMCSRLLPVIPLLAVLSACNTDPKVACKKYVDNGNKYFSRTKYKEASIMYRKALNKDMRYGDAWYHLGLTNLKLGIPNEALRDFSRAAEVDPNNTDAIVQLGNIDLFYYMAEPQANRAQLTDLKDVAQKLLKKDPKSFDGLRFTGYVLLMQKDLKGAIQKFEEADKVKPDQPEMTLALVQTLFGDGRTEEGEKRAKQLIARDKTYAPVYDILYVYYIQRNHGELGEELLKQKIAANPAQGAYVLQLALHYYMTKRTAEMTSTLQRLTSDPKTFPDGHMQAGDFYLRIRDFDSALAQFEQGQKDDAKNKRNYQKKMVEVLGTQRKNDQASKLVTALLKEDPKDPQVIAMHATLMLQTGDRQQLKNVVSELQPLVSKMPGNATLHYNLGRAYMGLGDPQSLDQAKLQFQEALKFEPRYSVARVALAELYMKMNDHAKAVQTADEVLKTDQTNPGAHLVRATSLLGMGENTKAREELTLLLKMYPKLNDARFTMGQLNLVERRFKEAEDDFSMLTQVNDPRGLPGVMEARIDQGHPEQAIQYAEEQLQKSPDRDDYRYALGKTYFRAGRFKDAAAQYQKLLDKNPKSADLYLRIGECRTSARDFNGAVDSYKKAKELEPNNYLPPLLLALTYDAFLGRNEDARKSYEDVIKLQPDNVEALNNLAYLKADDGIDLDQALAYAQRARQKRPADLDVVDTPTIACECCANS
jgi:tetratricopeptide (TPR) repeat protein